MSSSIVAITYLPSDIIALLKLMSLGWNTTVAMSTATSSYFNYSKNRFCIYVDQATLANIQYMLKYLKKLENITKLRNVEVVLLIKAFALHFD